MYGARNAPPPPPAKAKAKGAKAKARAPVPSGENDRGPSAGETKAGAKPTVKPKVCEGSGVTRISQCWNTLRLCSGALPRHCKWV